MVYTKKIANLLIVLASLILIGCGGGSSGTNDSPIVDDNTTPDSNMTIDDFDDAVPHDPSFKTDHFSGSQNCVQCHDDLIDENETDVSLVHAWQGTIMANAATDPLWKAKVATEVKEHPEFKQTIEAKCSRCHTPMANVEAKFDDPSGDTISLSEDGFFNHENLYYDAAMQGVSCTLCHQIKNTSQLGTTEGFSGNFEINGTVRNIYGPYQKPVVNPMQMQLDYTPVFSEHTEDSKLCASCHNLETPVIATDGSLTNFTFPEQAAYTEWEYSDFNGTKDTCQNCHMPKAEGSLVISTKGQGVEPRPNFHQHKFLGANTYMLEILKNNRVKLGALADETRFDESITDTREFLKSAAVINIGNTVFLNRTLSFDVNVTNKSGHKFPTGFPSRRVWLHVTVKNTANQIVFESGGFNSEGQIIGVDDTLTANTYEPHYEKINDESQVQVYETILSDTDDNMTYILLHALHYLKDNRILPKGLDKNDINLPETINPHGNAENDSNFIGGSDTVKYEIENLAADNYTITATLYYQTLSYGFAQDLYKNSELPEVALMKLLDANTTNHYETISADSTSIIVP
ncbi:MAG: hypothetical protein HKP62_01815 [Sulfurovum sp.]|nr:hypothetical protein [Sulfurovum sp.]NNJ44729.1 hypothetical protein [Sulfurovum sp.]